MITKSIKIRYGLKMSRQNIRDMVL